MRAVSDIAANVRPGDGWQAGPPTPPARVPQPTKLDELEITHPVVKTAIDAARAWAERKREGVSEASLVLCGPYGTGKTHIARAILWSIRYTADGRDVAPVGRFFTANDLLDKLGSVRDAQTGITSFSRAGEVIGNVPIVVIDDVGSTQQLQYIGASPDAQEAERHARYFKAIDYCYTYRISVIMTSNLKPADIAQHIGGRSWDRLSEMAPRGFIIDMTGVPSWRQKASGR